MQDGFIFIAKILKVTSIISVCGIIGCGYFSIASKNLDEKRINLNCAMMFMISYIASLSGMSYFSGSFPEKLYLWHLIVSLVSCIFVIGSFIVCIMIQKKTDNPDFWHYPCEDKEDVPEDKESCLCVYDGGLYIGIYDAEKEKWFTDTGAEAVTPVRWVFTSDLI